LFISLFIKYHFLFFSKKKSFFWGIIFWTKFVYSKNVKKTKEDKFYEKIVHQYNDEPIHKCTLNVQLIAGSRITDLT